MWFGEGVEAKERVLELFTSADGFPQTEAESDTQFVDDLTELSELIEKGVKPSETKTEVVEAGDPGFQFLKVRIETKVGPFTLRWAFNVGDAVLVEASIWRDEG